MSFKGPHNSMITAFGHSVKWLRLTMKSLALKVALTTNKMFKKNNNYGLKRNILMRATLARSWVGTSTSLEINTIVYS